MYQVTRIPIWQILMYFLMYIACHIGIAMMAKHWTNKFEKSKWEKDIKRNADIWNFLNKWFPAMYVVFLMIIFYL
jgi:hypothetical protein